MESGRESSANHLLRALPPDVSERFEAQLEVLDIELRHSVYEPDRPSEYVYFPLSGIISIHKKMRDGVAVEVATIGNEGMVGLEIFLGGEQTPASAFCQIAGRAARIGAAAFREAVRDSAPLTALLLRYTQAVLTQIAQSAACNRMHSIDERCARWLLMTHDRVGGDRFELTQEFLAEMLGVRRPSVSIAAGILQRAGFIRYSRGRVEVIDRTGLESAACECYAVIAREYERLIGAPS
ncbi:MAG: Crp/Fnr family transcriptional regulator [Alphaproteobacteria bacterium]|nr:Crp/Fnr family transcriptional regulator [Alphaproteobacteria bacterium]